MIRLYLLHVLINDTFSNPTPIGIFLRLQNEMYEPGLGYSKDEYEEEKDNGLRRWLAGEKVHWVCSICYVDEGNGVKQMKAINVRGFGKYSGGLM